MKRIKLIYYNENDEDKLPEFLKFRWASLVYNPTDDVIEIHLRTPKAKYHELAHAIKYSTFTKLYLFKYRVIPTISTGVALSEYYNLPIIFKETKVGFSKVVIDTIFILSEFIRVIQDLADDILTYLYIIHLNKLGKISTSFIRKIIKYDIELLKEEGWKKGIYDFLRKVGIKEKEMKIIESCDSMSHYVSKYTVSLLPNYLNDREFLSKIHEIYQEDVIMKGVPVKMVKNILKKLNKYFLETDPIKYSSVVGNTVCKIFDLTMTTMAEIPLTISFDVKVFEDVFEDKRELINVYTLKKK